MSITPKAAIATEDDDSIELSSFIMDDISMETTASYSSDDDNGLICLAVCEAAVIAASSAEQLMKHYTKYFLFQPMLYESAAWGGSTKGKLPNKDRDFGNTYCNLKCDYFSNENSVYDEYDFERRFRVPRVVFNVVYEACLNTVPFIFPKDCLGNVGIHPWLVRVVACFRYLSYGRCYDGEDEYLRLSESTIQVAVRAFLRIIQSNFGNDYLNRNPNQYDKRRILQINKMRGFPRLFASRDCSQFKWEKCPIELHGAYKSRKGKKQSF